MNEGPPDRFPFLDPSSLSRAVIVCHRNADADAYLSAFALSSLVRQVSPSCAVGIAVPEGMTTLTAKLSKKFPHRVVEVGEGDYDLYVAVDVGDTALLKEWREKMRGSQGVKVLVDHHPLQGGDLYDHIIVDQKATSAAEVVYGLFAESGRQPDPVTAQALLEALLFDSSHLAIAGPGALRTAVALIDSGADLASAKKELRTEPDYGEVVAKLKGAQRAKFYRAGDWVVSTSSIGSFQAHVARALVYLGSDVSLVGGETEGETRVSARATQRFAENTGIQLGTQVAEEMAKRLGGHGGGHATAASFSTGAGEEEAMGATMKRVAELIGAELKEIT
jgi:nanoRNase/pAp phosphatase (c-di-AMP/oligoRNAs hydrolase)